MRRLSRLVVVIGLAGAVGAGLVACGDETTVAEQRRRRRIIRGTTDQPVSYDPAGAYDLPSYDVIYNVYQNLLQFPPGGNKPEPEAAESCDFTDDSRPTSARCKDGLKFSDGSDLTAEDVVFSFERNVEIADPQRRLVAAREHEERRGARRQDRRLQPQGAGRDLALGAGHGVVRDRALRRVPGRQAAADATR